MKCSKHRNDGEPCGAQAVAGTDACRTHAGRPLVEQKARGAVAMEVSRWALGDQTLDPGVTLLRLMTQSVRRAELYGKLLEQAYEAAERLAEAEGRTALDEPPNAGNAADRDRAMLDLERVFNTGGVATLIGHTYASSGGEMGGVFASGEAIRGLVQLEAQERDRAASMAAKAAAAKLGERQVALAEEQARQVVGLLRGTLVELAQLLAAGEITTVDPGDPTVVRVVSTRLRALDAAVAA